MRLVVSFDRDAQVATTGDSVWVVESPANRAAAERSWRDEIVRSSGNLTVFEPQDVQDLLPTLLEHHADCDRLSVQGAELTSETQHQLEAFGFVSFRKVEDGFFAAKDPHAA
jgi:hypothetical protein